MQEDVLRKDARTIFDRAIEAADPERAVKAHLRRKGHCILVNGQAYDLRSLGAIYVVGGGKAAGPMARALEEILGERITEGIVVTKKGYGVALQTVRLREAGHPLPDAEGAKAVEEITALLSRAGEKDLVFCLLSGGASALLADPADGISLIDLVSATELLLKSGASIGEINAVRKHLSLLKGGQMARMASPAQVISLIISDVVGDCFEDIASGPTVPDPSTFADCLAIWEKYGIAGKMPAPVQKRWQRGMAGDIAETPKDENELSPHPVNVIIASNRGAVDAARRKAKELGYRTLVLSTSMNGEAREVAKVYAAIAREVGRSGKPIRPPSCLLAGGETTVTVRGNGTGGRNQELALAAAMSLDGVENIVLLAGGTDGTDGPTDAAGAMCDGRTAERARQIGLDPLPYLLSNNSYAFFQHLGDLLITGPTRTNVMDVHIILIGAPL